MNEQEQPLEEANFALSRVQDFDPDKLVRREELGKHAFTTAVEPARKIVNLLRTLPVSHLGYFPDQQLELIRDSANSAYNLFKDIEKFDVESAQPSVVDAKESIVQSLQYQFQHLFNTFSPLIAFAISRSQDFASLEREARAAIQSAQDQAQSALEALGEQRKIGEQIIQEVRAAAAEQGVSKQAIYFKVEADTHKGEAKTWLIRTLLTSVVLSVFAISSLFAHNVPGLGEKDPFTSGQLAVSKVLIFSVLAYFLILCARNFLSHKHNEVVNRHRQNALSTFTALVEAASESSHSDIVLTHAAACIFSPQETGYAKQEAGKFESPALQILSRAQQSGAVG